MIVRSEVKTFKLHNNYAYKFVFNVRKHKQKCKAGTEQQMEP